MCELLDETVQGVNHLLSQMLHHGLMLNERYVHHFFSHELQLADPGPLDLPGPTCAIKLHPEWPTYKEATGINYARYRKRDGRYQPVEVGTRGGAIDFAVGQYSEPRIGVEFKLLHSWNGEAVTFDFIKLLDKRNPFEAAVSVVILIRRHGLTRGGQLDNTRQAINAAYTEAINRLGESYLCDPARRRQLFVASEIAGDGRRHWYNDTIGGVFAEGGNVPPLVS